MDNSTDSDKGSIIIYNGRGVNRSWFGGQNIFNLFVPREQEVLFSLHRILAKTIAIA